MSGIKRRYKGLLYYFIGREGCFSIHLKHSNECVGVLLWWHVLNRRFVYEMKRPKRDKKLPVVLSREEVSGALVLD